VVRFEVMLGGMFWVMFDTDTVLRVPMLRIRGKTPCPDPAGRLVAFDIGFVRAEGSLARPACLQKSDSTGGSAKKAKRI
jgi:hypothetical protein